MERQFPGYDAGKQTSRRQCAPSGCHNRRDSRTTCQHAGLWITTPRTIALFGALRSQTDTLTQVACARIDLPSFIPTVRSAPEFHRIVRVAVRHCARGLYHRSGIARQPCRTHPAPKVFVFCGDDLAMDGCCLHCTNNGQACCTPYK